MATTSSTFNVGGLITGLDTNTIISQLMQIERQPITRVQDQITTLQKEQTGVKDLRTQLLASRNKVQDFKLKSVFDQFKVATSADTVMGADISGSNPVVGSYSVNVTNLASATVASSSAILGHAIDPAAALNSSGLTTAVNAGTFSINGVSFTIDPATQSLNTILGQINSSTAGVTATYDAAADKVTIANTASGNTSLINFGATADTSNFLAAIAVNQATQSTNGSGSTTASSTRNLGAIDPSKKLNTVNFAGGAVTAGTFQINGISITMDPTTDALADVLQRINDSDAHVTASYDTASDKIRLVADTLGSRTISFVSGTSNFLNVTNLATAAQTAGSDATFTINGGAVQTRNTNEVSDAIGGVTLRFLSSGSSTITVSGNDDQIVTDVQSFLTAFNDSIDKIRSLTATDGALSGDSGISDIANFLQSAIFNQVPGLSGTYSSLVDIGISTGDAFDPEATAHLQLNEDTFRDALHTNRLNVKGLFNNTGQNGIADDLFSYLDDATKYAGFLNDRSRSNGSIDKQIQDLNDQISSMEERASQKETRLRQQFAQLEQMAATFQSQGAAISKLGSGLSTF